MGLELQSLLILLNWMSPTFPIGNFAYSHGLEQAIVDGRVRTPEDVENWIGELIQSGSAWNDAVLFALCWCHDLHALNQFALALAGSAERYQETVQLGRNFDIAASTWTGQAQDPRVTAYPIATGRACCRMGVPQRDAVAAFLHGFASALVSVAVRLVPLGQTNGLVVLRNLAPIVERRAVLACDAGLEDVGSHCLASDIAAMRHETLVTRIFRS